MIELTEEAAKQIGILREQTSAGDKPLRMSVRKGGCSGMEYDMGFDSAKEGDQAFEQRGVNIVMTQEDLEHLKGTKVHFDDGLHGKGFEIINPNAKNTCGCGKSFN